MRRHGHHLGTVGNKRITTCSLSEEPVHSQGPSRSHAEEAREIRGKLDKMKIIVEG